MFVRFVVSNHRSLREEIELSFISTSRGDEPAFRIPSKHHRHGLLPIAGIWGGNATGKTNLVGALLFLRGAVANSHNRWGPTASVPWSPWQLRTGPTDPPTTMEIEFVLDGSRYAYGFRFRSEGFEEEWLFRWETSRRQVLFHRSMQEEDPWYFGPSFSGPKASITETVRSNGLFLSAAAQANHPIALSVYEKLVDGIEPSRAIQLSGYPTFHRDHPMLAEAFKPKLLRLLRAADLGVDDVLAEEVDAELPQRVSDILPSDLLRDYREGMQEQRRLRLFRGGDRPWSLEPEEESRGTQVLVARLSDVVVALRDGGLLVIDEIDTSLHPDLCRELVEVFTNPATNAAGAQLMFTTHDRGLLRSLRTDEINLLDKAQDGSTTLAAASDYVRGRVDVVTAHRAGRLGGIPLLGSLAGALEGR